MSKQKQSPIFYGLDEPLVVFQWHAGMKDGGLRGVVVCRALPLYRRLRGCDEVDDLHFVGLQPQLMVCQIMNYMPLLEEYRGVASVKASAAIGRHLASLKSHGFALCVGQAIDMLKFVDAKTKVEWKSYPAKFVCNDTPGGLLFQISVGAHTNVPAFRTRMLSTTEMCRRTYEYVVKRASDDAKSRSVSQRE